MQQDDLRQTLGVDRLINEAVDRHHKGDLTAAEGLYSQVLDQQSDHLDALHSLGFLRYQQGRLTEALSLIGGALRAEPDFPPALVNHALVLQALNRPAEALAGYDRALTISPAATEVLYNRGNALRDYYRGGNVPDLEGNACERALSIAPGRADIHNYRGTALRDLNRLDEALASYDKALSIEPGHAEARSNRKAILRRLNGTELEMNGLLVRTSAGGNAVNQQGPGSSQMRTNTGFGYGATASSAPQQPSNHEKQQMALAVARAFEPKRVVGFDKVRVGRDCDGGYVQVNDFAGVGAALSGGISNDASWDLDIAKRNIPVQQFDPTIDKAPVTHPLLTFHKLRVGATDDPGAICIDTMAERFLGGSGRALLKLDIEGDEWRAFAAASAQTLARFSQIMCEFHGLYYAAHPVWHKRFMAALTKLRTSFEVVHVHGNNGGPYANVANVILPSTLEVTFANRSFYQFAESNETFPTALDRPNLPSEPEMRLGYFKF